jgi:hypothetical protein
MKRTEESAQAAASVRVTAKGGSSLTKRDARYVAARPPKTSSSGTPSAAAARASSSMRPATGASSSSASKSGSKPAGTVPRRDCAAVRFARAGKRDIRSVILPLRGGDVYQPYL